MGFFYGGDDRPTDRGRCAFARVAVLHEQGALAGVDERRKPGGFRSSSGWRVARLLGGVWVVRKLNSVDPRA